MASCRGIYQRELRAQEDGVEGVKTIFNEYQLEIHVPVRTVYRIKYVLYMYNLGTAPNVQNWAGFAACTPSLTTELSYTTVGAPLLHTLHRIDGRRDRLRAHATG